MSEPSSPYKMVERNFKKKQSIKKHKDDKYPTQIRN